jgi:hypothetical protein
MASLRPVQCQYGACTKQATQEIVREDFLVGNHYGTDHAVVVVQRITMQEQQEGQWLTEFLHRAPLEKE